MWTGLLIGLGLGGLLSVPAAGVWSRRAERRRLVLQRRAQRAERLAELGRMTGGLAHEIKNPLSTVGLNVQLLQEDVADAQRALAERAFDPGEHPRAAARDADLADQLARVERRLEGLHRETQRLREILDDFLRFAGRLQLHREPTDVHALLEELADFFAPQAEDAGVRLRLDLHAEPCVASVDAGLLKQALLNLMLNATQAMEQSRGNRDGAVDELHLRTTSDAPDAVGLRKSMRTSLLGQRGADDRSQPAICIHVTDTGPGIGEDVLPQIFEPYFSKKRGGTGLGLPTTKRIVEEHGGGLSVHSEVGRGTSFTIRLPLGDAGLQGKSAEAGS